MRLWKLFRSTKARVVRSDTAARASESELARALGAIEADFDEPFYRARYPDLAHVKDLAAHYLRHGWREGRDPAEWFSVQAYLVAYPDVAAGGIEPFSHYLLYGRAEGREAFPVRGSDAADHRAFAEATGVALRNFPEDFAPQSYRLAAGLADASRWAALEHFFHHGLFDPFLLAAARAGPGLLGVLGLAKMPRDEGGGLYCCQLAVHRGLRDAAVFHAIGDVWTRRERPMKAVAAYRSAIALGHQYFWTSYNLGRAHAQLGEFNEAVERIAEACRLRPDKAFARHELARVAGQRFQLHWMDANAISLEGADAAASERMVRAIGEYRTVTETAEVVPTFPCRSADRRLRVAIFGSDSLLQCKLYRMIQKVDQLNAVGQDIEVFTLAQAATFARRVASYDVVIVFRAPATPEVIDVLALAGKFGVTIFYDIDDLIFDDTCYPPDRAALAGMVSEAEYAGLVTGRALFREAMAMCDFGIASTPPIQAEMAKIVRSGQCFLSRNALGRAHLRQIERIAAPRQPAGESFVFFYGSGSRSHNENFAVVAAPLAELMRAHPHIRLQVIGPVELGEAFDGLDERVERLAFLQDPGEYWQVLAGADVNLAPLLANAFNDGKSEIKWLEAAMLGIPSIVSASAVYDAVIRSGEDGWIASDAADWRRLLGAAVENPRECARIGAVARERAIAEYDMARGGEELLGILQSGYGMKHPALGSTRPRLLVVNIFYPPEYIGGATRVVEQLVNDTADVSGSHFEIEVLCGREPDGKPGLVDRYMWNDVPVTTISPFTDADAIERSVETASFFQSYLDHVQPDIIHFHCIQRLTASLLDVAAERGIPFVVTAHDGWWVSDQQFLIEADGTPVAESGNWGARARIERLREVLAKAAATVTVSASHGALYRDRGIPNVLTIANGSETIGGVLPPPSEGPVWLGLLGGLGVAKGALLLKKALQRRRFDNLRFLIVDHSMLEGTSRHERWGQNDVEIVGKTSFANVAEIYSRLHGVLAISVCIESYGLVAREAQRLGRWVIASDRGGIGEDVIEGENGFVIDPARVDSLLVALDHIQQDPARYRNPPGKCPPLRGRRDVAEDYLALYTRILEARDLTSAVPTVPDRDSLKFHDAPT